MRVGREAKLHHASSRSGTALRSLARQLTQLHPDLGRFFSF